MPAHQFEFGVNAMRKYLFILFFMLGLSLSAWGGGRIPPGKIAYVHEGDIWVVNPDGSQNNQLTRFGNCSYPSWSPDGTKIVFLRGENLWIMTSDGQGSIMIPTRIDAVERPVWIPGKKEIAFGSLDAKAICSVSLSGGNHRVLARGKPYAWGPSFARDGRFFICFAGNHQEGRVVRADLRPPDSSPAPLVSLTPWSASYPALSPDGKQVVFVREGNIWLMSSTGKNIKKLVSSGKYSCKMPSWSPDGRFVVFRSEDRNGFVLRLVDAGSGAVRTILTGFDDPSDPAWSFNGR